jgi:N-formylglutamate amidohydrolase
MNLVEPQAAAVSDPRAPFDLNEPQADRRGALIFASPHSGSVYPDELMAASVLDLAQIRVFEDAMVDALIAEGATHGAAVLTNRFARAYVDVNRQAWELDPAMFEDDLPDYARGRSARVAAGLGAIARVVGGGREIYGRKLRFAEAETRIARVHRPYHEALRGLVDAALGRAGFAVVIDWHSMPAAAARTGQGLSCDFVLGDRFGRACHGGLAMVAERALTALGYAVARNTPYAGGYTTEHYGQPDMGVHALQIEISRQLYLDEASQAPTAGYAILKRNLSVLFEALAAWRP